MAAIRRSPEQRRRPALLGCAVLAAAACWAAPALGFASAPAAATMPRRVALAGRPRSSGEERLAAAGARRSLQGEAAEAAPAVGAPAGGRARRFLAAGALALAVVACGASPAAAKAVVAAPVWAVLPLDKLYLAISYFPVVYFLPLILLPRWSLTKKYGKSQLPFVLLGAFYVYCAAVAVQYSAGLLPFLQDLVTGQATLAKWRALLVADSAVGAMSMFVWAGLKIADVFVGRHIYLDSLKSQTFALHSMLATLCVNGAVGYLLHVFTKALNGRYNKGISQNVDEEDPLPDPY